MQIRKIFKLGHSLVVTFRPKMLHAIGLDKGDLVTVEIHEDCIYIRPFHRRGKGDIIKEMREVCNEWKNYNPRRRRDKNDTA